MLNDISGCFAQESTSNFAYSDMSSGYAFNSYIYNINMPLSTDFNNENADSFNYLAIRAYSPSETFQSLVRFYLPQRYDFGYISLNDLSNEQFIINSISNVNPDYKAHLNLFNQTFSTNRIYGATGVPGFSGSNISTVSFGDFLKQCEFFGSRLILLGDVNQLPSIGPGQILYQLIKSNIFTVTKLIKIKRQKSGGLVTNIYKMTNQPIKKRDFVDDSMVLLSVDEFIANNKINEEKLINLINENNFNENNTKFISNFKKPKYLFNTKTLNNILQNLFNPIKENFESDVINSNFKYENSFAFRKGDKIIRTENDYASIKMRANGEEATILDFDGIQITIQYSGPSDEPEKIGINELYENFVLNYAVTVHKSQGSQYNNVVYFIDPKCSFIEKKAIYTAISRARERCIIISNAADFINLQINKQKVNYKVSLFMEESDNYDL
jgi:ATP-dependent exoDNAse (exonuclease V) alpha subunit